jgi:hypothetical protein
MNNCPVFNNLCGKQHRKNPGFALAAMKKSFLFNNLCGYGKKFFDCVMVLLRFRQSYSPLESKCNASPSTIQPQQGRNLLSPGREAWVRERTKSSRGAAARFKASSKNIPWVIFDVMSFQERHKFLLEAAFAMMFFLITNVTNHSICIGFANAESSISVLPGKSSFVVAHPS